jgi:hypothetical protein
MLEDVAFRIARDGVPKVVLYEGKPVTVDGKRLYEVKYETRLLMKLLAARDREKYGEYKVVEVNWKDWDGDVSKLSPGAVRGLLDVLRKEAARQEAARQEAEEAAREAARQPVGILPTAVKERLLNGSQPSQRTGRVTDDLRAPSFSCRVMSSLLWICRSPFHDSFSSLLSLFIVQVRLASPKHL